jgi:hypothetical protein
MYHSRLENSVDPTAAGKDEENESDEAPEVGPQSKDYEFFVKSAFSQPDSADTKTRIDPWDAGSSERYFIGRDALALAIKPAIPETASRGGDTERLAVFVFHDEDRALQGLRRARMTALSLGLGVLLIGGLFLIGNIWGLRRTLSREDSVEYA